MNIQSKKERPLLPRFLRAAPPFFTARGFLLRAGELAAVFGLLHFLGFRRYTSILCGTTGEGSLEAACVPVLGLLYVLFYLAFAFVVPALLLAALLLRVAPTVCARCHKFSQDCHGPVQEKG